MDKINFNSIDIRELLDDLNVYYDEEGKNISNNWIGTTCPFCDDQSNHLGIHLDSLVISCFKCGTKGTILKYLANLLGSYQKALNILKGSVPKELRKRVQLEIGGVDTLTLPTMAKKGIQDYYRYLRSRNFDATKIFKKYGLMCCKDDAKFGGRIIVPIYYKRRMVTFTTVDIDPDSDLRYKHCKDKNAVIPIKNMLYGLPDNKTHSIIVVEGLMDKWRIGDGCVCTFGTKVTADQKFLLSRFAQVKILFDGDKDGYRSGKKLAEELAPFCDTKLFTLPEGVDPDQLSRKEVRHIKEA